MVETSMIPGSGTQAAAEGATQKLTIQQGQAPVCSGHISAEVSMFPVRVTTSEDTVLLRLNVQLLRRQREHEEANEAIRRRLRG
jgi:hypothetical protein